MTKHEVDVIGGLNMTDQISNEAYKQIMIAAQDENEVGAVLDEIRAEIEQVKVVMNEEIIEHDRKDLINFVNGLNQSLMIIDKYRKERE